MRNFALKPNITKPDEIGLLLLCQKLIQLKSYTGEEGQVAEYLAKMMLELGYDRVWIDAYGSVVGEIKGNKTGPVILFDGHIDTVEVTDGPEWTVPPFEGVIKDGRIFGRGADDMKCALAAMVYGLAPLASHREEISGSIFVSGTVCEETFEGLAMSKIVDELKPDFVVIGEASALNLKRGQRGRAEVVLTVNGKAAHSSNPGVGKNAVYMTMELLALINRLPISRDPFLGEGLLELTDIVSAPYPGASVVPHKCRVTFDRRLLVGETEESVLEPIRMCVRELQITDPLFEADVQIVVASQECYTGAILHGKRMFPAWVMPEEHPIVVSALAGIRAVGLDPKVTKYSFCTNGSYSAGSAGIPTIGFGPGAEDGAHVVDECIEIDQINKAAVGYQAIAFQILLKD